MGKIVRLTEPKANVYPVPIALVTCCDETETNIITIAWTGVLSSSPPTVYISVRPSRYSYNLLQNSRQFCINIPTSRLIQQVDLCGIVSGRDRNKADLCHFDLIPIADGYPKAIKQCPHHLFCSIIKTIELGSHTMFISSVDQEYIDEEFLTKSNTIDYNAIKPIAYCKKTYYSLGNAIGEYGTIEKGYSQFI